MMASRFLLPALAILAAVPARAADTDAGLITVTGRGLADRPGDAAAGVTTLDRARILASPSTRLENILADIPGLQQFRRSDSRSANPTSQGLNLRGLGGNAASRALLILDGVPQADPFGGWVAFPAYATGRLGRVRVTRGGGSGYWGPGALAGTIELESAAPGPEGSAGDGALPAFGASLAGGSFGQAEAQAGAALVRPGGFLTASGAYARGDGFVPIVARQRGAADRAAPYEQASGALRGVLALDATTELQANISAFTDRRERGTAFTANLSEGADASLRLVGNRNDRSRWGWQALAYVQTRNFESQFAGIDAARSVATQTLDQFGTPATGVGGRMEVSPPVGAGIGLRVGADIRALDGRTRERFTFVAGAPTRLREAGGRSTSGGIFVDGDWQAGAVTLTLAGRIDWWRIADGRLQETTLATAATLTDTRFADRSGTELTGRAGMAWQAADWLTLRAAGYRGWRLPTLNELYRPFRAGADATAANAGLAPERLTGVEAGLALAPAAGISLGATLFWNRLENAIANVSAGTGPGVFPGVGFVGAGGSYRVRRNLDAIRSWGFEIDAGWRRGPFGVRAAWSHVAPRVAASGAAAGLNALRPAQTPRDSVSATLDYTDPRFTLLASVRHFGEQFEDDQNSRVLAAATTVDAFASVAIGGGVSIEARGENLFDAEVQAGISGAGIVERATPRTLWLGVRVTR